MFFKAFFFLFFQKKLQFESIILLETIISVRFIEKLKIK